MGTSYQDLVAWQKAMDLVTDVCKVTGAFPKEELYGLTSQLRRVAVSVPSNIAEGQGRKGDGEFRHFLRISLGSLMEVETQIMISERLGYLKPDSAQTLLHETGELGRVLNGLIKSLT
ncbi:MAG: four helix bundle protein [Candidatus Korobacteraceae bacterium]